MPLSPSTCRARLAIALAFAAAAHCALAQANGTGAAPATGAELDVLRFGSFEALDDDGNAAGWKFPSKEAASLMDADDGSRFVRLRPFGLPDARKIEAPIVLKPLWKRLKLSARVRGEGLKPGAGQWQTAHVGVVFFDRQSQVVGFSDGVALEEDAGWAERKATVTVPRGAVLAIVDAGNFGTAGDFFVDDILVIPDEARA